MNIFRPARILLICILFLGQASSITAQQELIDPTGFGREYMLRLSGVVLNEKFDGVEAILKIASPNPESLNDYLVIVLGYPTTNERNTFFWNSDQTEMTVFADEITCKIKGSYIRKADSHFFYLSPVLLGSKGSVTQHEEERRRHAEQTARPSKVFGQAGELHLRFYSDEVTGTVWMTGYDSVEHSYVRYRACISGQRIQSGMEPRQEPRR